MKRLILLFVLVSFGGILFASTPPAVPKEMKFCGMALTLTPKAKARAQEIVDQLHASPKSYAELVERSNMYMPFIEEALDIVGVPEDLKYLAIVESWLKGDAVSKSNAVGFWQFKDFTAKEVGLLINDQVDERKHIFRSSIGAGRYLYKLNQRFGNWIYAIIGYNQGGTGAIPFTDKRFYGKDKMTIPDDVHRYALKAIAYKIALENEIDPNSSLDIWLEPKSNGRTVSVEELANLHELDLASFKEINLWISGDELPKDRFFTYYIPHHKEIPQKDLSDPHKGIYLTSGPVAFTELDEKPTESTATTSSSRKPVKSFNKVKFHRIPLVNDDASNKEFTLVKKQETMVEVAVRKGVSTKNLRKWNNIPPGVPLNEGEVLLLKPKNKVKIHRVRHGETLMHISRFYEISIAQIRKKNRMSSGDHLIYQGQKLYLRKKKPKKEKVVILEIPKKKPVVPKLVVQKPKPKPIVQKEVLPAKTVPEKPKPTPTPSPSPEVEQTPVPVKTTQPPEKETILGTHIVQKGETMWSISQKYNMSVEEVQQLNGFSNNDIDAEQVIKVRISPK